MFIILKKDVSSAYFFFCYRLNMQELSNAEKDLIILGMICCSINATPLTITAKQHNDWRKSSRIRCFYHEHRRICRDTFLYLMEISKDKLTNLKKHYLENGLAPRKKKSGKFRVNVGSLLG